MTAFGISLDASKSINVLVFFSSKHDKLVMQYECNEMQYTLEFEKDQVVDSIITYDKDNNELEVNGVLPKAKIICDRNQSQLVNKSTYIYNNDIFKRILMDYINHRDVAKGVVYTALESLDDLVSNTYGDINILFSDKIMVDSRSGLFNFVNFIKDNMITDIRMIVSLCSLVSKHWGASDDKKHRCPALAEYIIDTIPESDLDILRYNLCNYLNGLTSKIEYELETDL
ncbi:hypothetical protein Murmansk-164 [Murmansk poxvirus]|uniref:Uncharacterized protein n=1 Tax=Murmansk poxvirus TaxID=2025359 RepID=A0A223FN01_9POXV|nr:hypothetical protein CKM52_gp164 [Murmansk poxvirus]AST09359.1 hypothetical protein Murmansk-164 [Murmansk poxvirus]